MVCCVPSLAKEKKEEQKKISNDDRQIYNNRGSSVVHFNLYEFWIGRSSL